MKRTLFIVFGIIALSVLAVAAKPDATKQYQLNLSTLFRSDDEWVYEINIETAQPTKFYLRAKDASGEAVIYGNTSKARRGRSEAKAWLVMSQISQSGKPTYLKTILKTDSATTTGIRELSTNANSIRFLQTTNKMDFGAQPLNTPIEIASIDDLRITLLVGPAAESSPGGQR